MSISPDRSRWRCALGRRLGSAATAIYWHVDSKDNLISLAADQAAATVFTFVLGHALGAAADASLTRRLSRDGGHAEELIRDHVARATELAAQFPRLRARLGTGLDDAATDYGAAPGGSFEFGLRAILDGLAAQLAAAGSYAAGAPPNPGPGTPR